MIVRKQQGLSLSSLLVWATAITVIAIFSMKLVPAYLEHSVIEKNLTAIVSDVNSGKLSVNQIRTSFSKYAQIDNIKSVNGQDIIINKNNDRVNLTAKYTSKIPLIANLSLLIDFEAKSKP
ncbi:MAG: DUF4845 domain-containing protein [Nitrosomonas sp.]